MNILSIPYSTLYEWFHYHEILTFERSLVVGLEIITTEKILAHLTKADDIFFMLRVDCSTSYVAPLYVYSVLPKKKQRNVIQFLELSLYYLNIL